MAFSTARVASVLPPTRGIGMESVSNFITCGAMTRGRRRKPSAKRRVSNAALIALSKVLQGAHQGAAYHW